jgi:Na+-translocating ferredoxin:NAD+ oxidoreductase RnfD subunit
MATALDPFTLAGFAGAAVLIVAYLASQQGALKADHWQFPLANLVGSVLIMLSLVTAWNLPSAVIEVFWAAISLYGLARHARH